MTALQIRIILKYFHFIHTHTHATLNNQINKHNHLFLLQPTSVRASTHSLFSGQYSQNKWNWRILTFSLWLILFSQMNGNFIWTWTLWNTIHESSTKFFHQYLIAISITFEYEWNFIQIEREILLMTGVCERCTSFNVVVNKQKHLI